ncbi:MAG: hypothetical protein EBZ48_10150, partial [Proteobacteria bacterium]|nr:hypothetical protein [Pseudomonadota bacterium]
LLQAPGGVNRDLLMAELKHDLATVSALSRFLLTQTQHPGCDGSLHALREVPESLLRELIKPEQLISSKHSLASIQSWQSSRLLETAVAVSAAQALSSSYDVEAELAYTCALLRQLGLSLLAWNYPHVFRRALSVIRPGDSLDSTLGRILGFTPTLLTLTLLRSKDASPVILKTLGDTWVDSSLSDADMTLVDKLTSLCRLSEALARTTTSSTNGAVADSHWDLSRADFESRVGKHCWMILESELQWCLSSYAQYQVTGMTAPRMIRALSDTATRQTEDRMAQFEEIPAIRRCRPEDRRVINNYFLRAISPGGSETATQYLMLEALPNLGFRRGILFQRSSDQEQFSSHRISKGWDDAAQRQAPTEVVDRIRAAALLAGALQGEERSSGIYWIAGLLGRQGEALLYAELPNTTEPAQRAGLLNIFDGLRQAALLT